MKRPQDRLIPLIVKGLAPSAAAASGLLATSAQGEPGDLDPDFADLGRLGPLIDLEGPAWSLEALDSEGVLIAGGDSQAECSYYDYYCNNLVYSASNFVRQLTNGGSIDLTFSSASLADVQVFDVARQPEDGKVIAVGSKLIDHSTAYTQLVVFRLESDGSLDASFGVGGTFLLPAVGLVNIDTADSVVLDPDGHIVVSGARGDELIVLRLLPDGTLDDTFADGGIFIGPARTYGTHLVRTAAGGYRIASSNDSECWVLGLTADGATDASFGVAGITPVETPLGNAVYCDSMASQDDGRLLVSGIGGGQTFATRLLTTGAPDPAFATYGVDAQVTRAPAIAAAGDGKILVALYGDQGTMITRLLADGGIDPSFGNEGSTVIDLPSEHGSRPLIWDLHVRPDGSVIAAGGDEQSDPNRPFVIRLLGDSGGGGPGVLSLVQSSFDAAEGDQVVLNVRRTGGKTGSVSVAVETAPGDGTAATGGQDYGEVLDRLTWADGDTSTREIVVQVNNDAGAVEEPEQFQIALSDAQGGAGIGTRTALVGILADGEPSGQFAIESFTTARESDTAVIWVYRNYYSDGAVSVTVTPVAGTATAGADFVADPITVSWADQENDPRPVTIALNDDTIQEGRESFTVELSDPMGGAVIGPHAIGTIRIDLNDTPRPPPANRDGGGGTAGILSLLFLGLVEILRSLRRSEQTRRSLLQSRGRDA